MKSSRGQIMPLYVFILTLLMCGMVLGFYLTHQDGLEISLISPLSVLEVRDDLDIFEMREEELIKMSLEKVDSEFGSREFGDEFKEEFLSGMSREMEDFIFDGLIWRGEEMEGDFDREAFLENVLYSVEMEGVVLGLARSEIGKRGALRAGDARVSFPVDFEYVFSGEYRIEKKGSGFVVERV